MSVTASDRPPWIVKVVVAYKYDGKHALGTQAPTKCGGVAAEQRASNQDTTNKVFMVDHDLSHVNTKSRLISLLLFAFHTFLSSKLLSTTSTDNNSLGRQPHHDNLDSFYLRWSFSHGKTWLGSSCLIIRSSTFLETTKQHRSLWATPTS